MRQTAGTDNDFRGILRLPMLAGVQIRSRRALVDRVAFALTLPVATYVALSLLTERPFHLYNVRAKRDRPGLQPQHLMSVRAAAKAI